MWKNVLTFTKIRNDSITMERMEMKKRPYYYRMEGVFYAMILNHSVNLKNVIDLYNNSFQQFLKCPKILDLRKIILVLSFVTF